MAADVRTAQPRAFYNGSAEMWAPIGYTKWRDRRAAAASTARVRRLNRRHRRRSDRRDERQSRADAARASSEYEAGTMAVMPLRDAVDRSSRTALYVLLGQWLRSADCVANVAHLLLGGIVTRHRSLPWRVVLGGGAARIVRLPDRSLLLSAAAPSPACCSRRCRHGIATLAPVSLRGSITLRSTADPRLPRSGRLSRRRSCRSRSVPRGAGRVTADGCSAAHR